MTYFLITLYMLFSVLLMGVSKGLAIGAEQELEDDDSVLAKAIIAAILVVSEIGQLFMIYLVVAGLVSMGHTLMPTGFFLILAYQVNNSMLNTVDRKLRARKE